MVQLHWNEFKQSSVLSLTFNTSILKEQMLWLKFLSWNGPDCYRTIREIKPDSKCFCNYPIPTSFPLDYRMVMLPRLSDNITCDMSLSSSFPHVIISTRMRRKSKYPSLIFFLNKWRHDGIYQFFGLHFKLASLQSDPDVRNSPWRWKATPLSPPLFNLAIHNHMNSNFTHRPYSRSDPRPPAGGVFAHCWSKKRERIRCFCFLRRDGLSN